MFVLEVALGPKSINFLRIACRPLQTPVKTETVKFPYLNQLRGLTRVKRIRCFDVDGFSIVFAYFISVGFFSASRKT